jgi:O-acetylserine/cysteine efflux transporter
VVPNFANPGLGERSPPGRTGPDGRTIGLAIVLAVLLGLSFPGFRVAVQAVGPLWLSVLRFGWALPVVLVFWLSGPRSDPRPRPSTVALFGAFTLALPALVTMVAVAYVPAGQASVLSNTIPIWIVLAAVAGFGAAPKNTVTIGAAALGFVGVVLIVFQHGFGGPLWASGLLLLNAGLTALNATWLQRHFAPAQFRLVLLQGFAWSLILLAPFAFVLEPLPTALAAAPVFLTVALVGVFGTAGIYVVWYLLLERAPAARVSVYLYLGPVLSILLSVAFLEEALSAVEIIGIALVLVAAGVIDGYEGIRRWVHPRVASAPP